MRYTTIIYQVKNELDLNFLEYILLDIINIIQNAPQNTTPGWSSASRAYYGRVLDISDRQIRRYVEKLIERGLLERNTSHQLRTTEKWVNAAYMGESEKPGQNVRPDTEPTIREYHEKKVLFRDADVYPWEIFETYFRDPEFAEIDIHYYYQEMKRWSETKGEKRNNWIEQCKVLMSIHADKNKLRFKNKSGKITDALEKALHI